MRVFLVCAGIVALFVVSYLLWGKYFEELLGKEDKAREWFLRFGAWTWAIAILLIITDVALPIPVTAVVAVLGLIYGPVVGGLIGCAGTYLAGTAGYLLCRAMGERAARFLMGDRGLERMHRFFDSAGGWVVALSRWMIILPEMVSCLAGMTRMPPRKYFISLACGVVPMSFTYSFIGYYFKDERPILALAISAAVPVFLWPAAQWLLSRRSKEKPGNPSEGAAGNL